MLEFAGNLGERSTVEDRLHSPVESVPLSKPYRSGRELDYVTQLIQSGDLGSDGSFTKACSRLLEQRFHANRVFIVPSGTAGLEMAAMLCQCEAGDEVILPSFTFASTANAFLRAGAKPVFVDIRPDTLNLDERLVEASIGPKTKAIVPVHYAGVSCDMDALMAIASLYQLPVVEDAAQAVNSYYKGNACGAIGDLGVYSFHSTKDYTCGEGGALVIRSEKFVERAERIREKGTNRAGFLRGEVDKYTWVDVGSSYLPSELTSAYLLAQLEAMDIIKSMRMRVFARYLELLRPLEERGLLRLPTVPEGCDPNCHLFYLLLPDQGLRNGLLEYLRQRQIHSAFHFVPLHSSPMGKKLGYNPGELPVTEELSGRLLRLPFFPSLDEAQQIRVCDAIQTFVERGAGKSISPVLRC